MSAAAVILAAGAGSRFGGAKLLARIDGAPIVAHVVAAARVADLAPIVVVTGPDPGPIAEAVDGPDLILVVNPDPGRGLSSSIRTGIEAVEAIVPPVDAAVVLLGDQPLVRPEVIRALVGRLAMATDHTVAVPRYPEGGGANPVALARGAFGLAAEATGDRGLGPVIAAHPDVVAEVDVDGTNPDVDTTGDLASIAEASWADRVRRNRDQVERFREVPDGADFYASVSSTFRDDPLRTGDPVLDALLELAEPGDTWLDIGAGAGRYALPIARRVREVVAVDPSPGMLEALRVDAAANGIGNVRVVEGRWPPDPALVASLGPLPCADVALIAHVGYDIEAIGPFLLAVERAARRMCVAIMMERTPASAAEPFWSAVHGEPRISLPALPAFVDLLAALGRRPTVRTAVVERRRWSSAEELERFIRRQLWIDPNGPGEARFRGALADLVAVDADGSVAIRGGRDIAVGIVSWAATIPD